MTPDDEFPWGKTSENPLENKYLYTTQSELNAILNYRGGSLEGAKLYVTLFPCNECCKAIIQAGIKTVIYDCDKYADTPSVIASKRKFTVILNRCQGFRITVQTDVSDFCCRNHSQHTFYHTKTGTEDRHNCHFLSFELFYGCFADRGFNFNVCERQLSGCLVAHQHCNLADHLAELLGACVFLSDNTDFVLDQRVIHDDCSCHFPFSFV